MSLFKNLVFTNELTRHELDQHSNRDICLSLSSTSNNVNFVVILVASSDIDFGLFTLLSQLNFLLTMMDIPVNPPRLESPERCRVFYLLGAPRTGILERVDFFEEAKKHPWVIDAPYFCHEGKNVSIECTIFDLPLHVLYFVCVRMCVCLCS